MGNIDFRFRPGSPLKHQMGRMSSPQTPPVADSLTHSLTHIRIYSTVASAADANSQAAILFKTKGLRTRCVGGYYFRVDYARTGLPGYKWLFLYHLSASHKQYR